MREIIFRGKSADGKWKYGDLIQYENGKKTIINKDDESEVDPSTIGQYTGLKDCNGVRIFEGDTGKATLVDEEGGRYKCDATVFFSDFEYAVETDLDNWPIASWKCVEAFEEDLKCQ